MPIARLALVALAFSLLTAACSSPTETPPDGPDAGGLVDAGASDASPLDAAGATCEDAAKEWCALHAQCGPILPGDFLGCVEDLVDVCPGDDDHALCLADLVVQWPDGPVDCETFIPVTPPSCDWVPGPDAGVAPADRPGAP